MKMIIYVLATVSSDDGEISIDVYLTENGAYSGLVSALFPDDNFDSNPMDNAAAISEELTGYLKDVRLTEAAKLRFSEVVNDDGGLVSNFNITRQNLGHIA